jgi:hypothetical protein
MTAAIATVRRSEIEWLNAKPLQAAQPNVSIFVEP